jgi:hypothetical protein
MKKTIRQTGYFEYQLIELRGQMEKAIEELLTPIGELGLGLDFNGKIVKDIFISAGIGGGVRVEMFYDGEIHVLDLSDESISHAELLAILSEIELWMDRNEGIED